MAEWQKIETAPKDGTPFIAWVPSYFRGRGGHCIALWSELKLWDEKGWELTTNEATHWQPLPSPPQS